MAEFDWFNRETTEAQSAEDALAWAKEAYARLKAQQQGAPEAPLDTPPEVLEVPIVPTAPSLLEQAAAKRDERLASVSLAAIEVKTELTTEIQLDSDFLWSAEVLAAQGRPAAQVSIEEIDWLGKLRRGMEKTRQGFVTQLLENLGDDPLSEQSLEQIETLLLKADVGIQSTDLALDRLRLRMNEAVVDAAEAISLLKQELREQLESPLGKQGIAPLLAPIKGRLNIWLIVGVNGVGKTTTLGKLANLAVRSGYSCLMAAGDTFRAAAVQQLQVWAERSGVAVIANPSANADPAAVVFDAIGAARSKNVELLLVDTAGRLQTKHNLMEELAKVRRIIDRLAPEAQVESLLVLDSSQGQNGLRQAMAFAAAAQLTGVILTKLDGSAKGGVALAVAAETGLPIRFIGAGEGLRDLRPFNSFEFIEALLAKN
ncbi:signal recognition particle-docking protein FtsY [Synechococcus sp. UW140]|uniref:signal recognition particle-docking protein FtsY n=1 Tax=Synechococcus sp. UW140 TaxID=368503 RepID=UPI0025E6A449|nr:signal recognition particle-docking protein FtsY [Synechococcus sp. UW140]